MFAGNMGVYTGMRPGAFSISENERFPNKNPIGLLRNMFLMWTGTQEISWLVRKTLTECDSYECAH
jgi:acid ceramidase